MQPFVVLSSCDAEATGGTSCARDLMACMRLLESLGLKVEKPMVLYMDNKAAVDIFNSWNINSKNCTMVVRYAYLRELNKNGLIVVKWISTDDNLADLLTKNLDGPTFEKHTEYLCRRSPNSGGVLGVVDQLGLYPRTCSKGAGTNEATEQGVLHSEASEHGETNCDQNISHGERDSVD